MEVAFRVVAYLLVLFLGGVLFMLLSTALLRARGIDSDEARTFLALFWVPLFMAVVVLWRPF